MGFNLEEVFIKNTENNLGIQFSLSFKTKMMDDNGGEISIKGEGWFIFPFYDNSDKRRIKRTSNNITRETNLFYLDHDDIKNYVVFADNGSGDYLLFDKKNPTPVYMFLHESEIIKKVAEDFSDLM